MLLFLNIYAPQMIRNLIFRSQQTAMETKSELLASAVSDCEELTPQAVSEISRRAQELNTGRVIVTDNNGLGLYDSLSEGSGGERYYLFPELVEALTGRDIYYVSYVNNAVEAKAAVPLVTYNRLIGAMYLMDYDADMGVLIASLGSNLLWLSLALEAVIFLISLLFSWLFSGKLNKISSSVHRMRDGDYSAKVSLRGHDEVAELGAAFNDLSDRLNESERVRKQFVSDASHELKTPLASIKLLADSILQNPMDENTAREFVADIGNEADRLTRLTNRLLELTKLDMEEEVSTEVTDVNKTVQRVLRLLRPLADSHRIRMTGLYATHCLVQMKEDDLYQIVFNLVENGIKYNHEAGSLTASVNRENGIVFIVVEDTGLGIPEEARQHIFERFYRVDKARSRRSGGVGLGLSIVRDMVLRNSGEITVEPVESGGSRFTVALPVYEPETEEVPV